MKQQFGRLFSIGILALGLITVSGAAPLRLIIETDAGGDPDDEQSLVRFLLYANEWDVEGIIANRPIAREGENKNPERTGLGIAQRLLNAYGECWPNLVQHDQRYPTREYLWQRTVPGYDTTNSAVDLIIAVIDRPDPRPVWYSDWGTDHGAATNNLRRALDKVLTERGTAGYAKFKSKLRLTSYDMYGAHTTNIAPPFQIWINTFQPPLDGKRWYHRFSAITANAGGFNPTRDLLTGHGPLGGMYPTNTTHWLKEGDSPTFLYLVPTGMNNPLQPGWGSWAGRYGLNSNYHGLPYYWANQLDSWNGKTNRDNTLARWAAALQNDFRVRLDWCVKNRSEANHPPLARVAGALDRSAAPGDLITLDATDSSDPDDDKLSFLWEHYQEAGGCKEPLTIPNASSAKCNFSFPEDKDHDTCHFILTVTDAGDPPLSRYQRVIIKKKYQAP